jgi:hypothetical protein
MGSAINSIFATVFCFLVGFVAAIFFNFESSFLQVETILCCGGCEFLPHLYMNIPHVVIKRIS